MDRSGWLTAAIATAGLLAGPAAARADEFRCVFDMTRQVVGFTTPEPGTLPVGPPAPEAVTVGLARDYVYEVYKGGNALYIHFPSRRIVDLYLGEKTFVDASLYGNVAFRVNELINRRAMGEAMKAAELREVSDQLFDRFRAESELSLRSPVDKVPLTDSSFQYVPLGRGWSVVYGGETVVRFVPSTVRVPERFRRAYRHFLTYWCAIHPLVRDKILATGVLPETLAFVRPVVREKYLNTLRLRSTATSPQEWAGVPRDYAPRYDPKDPLDRILQAFEARRSTPPDTSRATLIQFVDGALKRGRVLDAYLGWWEHTAMTGDMAEDVRRWIVDTRSPQLRPFIGHGKMSPEDTQAWVKDIQATDRKGLTKGYVLDALCGGLLAELGRGREAADLLVKALEANPFLDICYPALGGCYMAWFDTAKAWQCYDTARRVNPRSRFLDGVRDLEARLARDFPEEF
jgi:hypothetical protein